MNQAGIIKSETFLNRPGNRMLVPLLTVLAEAFDTTPTTQKVISEYKKLTSSFGSEIKILTKVDVAEIAKVSGSKVAEGVDKDRKGDLVIDPGYDGVYGVVKIWDDKGNQVDQMEEKAPQMSLFD